MRDPETPETPGRSGERKGVADDPKGVVSWDREADRRDVSSVDERVMRTAELYARTHPAYRDRVVSSVNDSTLARMPEEEEDRRQPAVNKSVTLA